LPIRRIDAAHELAALAAVPARPDQKSADLAAGTMAA
jgi:hypothetical protein